MPESASTPAVTLAPSRLIEQCEMTFARRGGPGGQHRNKVSSAVILKHRATGITAEASERRSQADNRSVAISRLRIELAMQIRDDVSAAATELVNQHGGSKFRISSSNENFAVVLADVLNRTLANDGSMDAAAEFWKTSASQIVRFLKQTPHALDLVNRHRVAAGRHRMR